MTDTVCDIRWGTYTCVQAGVMQAQEVGLFGKIIHAISIDRGPLWFDGFGQSEHLNLVAEQLNKAFPKRMGRKRRFIFEYYRKNKHAIMGRLDINQGISNYKTFLVDLNDNIDDIRSNLKKKWRNILNKSEKSDLSVQIDLKIATLSALLRNYVQDRMQKGYSGASPKFLASLAKYAARNHQCIIMNASEGNVIIASVMIFVHGGGATYQVGWTTPHGRDKGAHHLLLWEAIKFLVFVYLKAASVVKK